MNNVTKSKSGFTIIEVVLVLAIAGLIFLIVFLAVPALQRSQRDTQRKSDSSRALSSLSNYKSNNRGNLPASVAERGAFETGYLKVPAEFQNPTGGTYARVWNTTSVPTPSEVQIAVGRICAGESLTAAGAGARNVAVRVGLEGGGIYCTSE